MPVPLDFLGDLRRTHYCGELRASDAGRRAVLMGWVQRRRDLGRLLFIDLRDRAGIAQVVFKADLDSQLHARAGLLRSEYVVAVEGPVVMRAPETVNSNLETGQVELAADKLLILNEARTPPFPLEDRKSVV